MIDAKFCWIHHRAHPILISVARTVSSCSDNALIFIDKHKTAFSANEGSFTNLIVFSTKFVYI